MDNQNNLCTESEVNELITTCTQNGMRVVKSPNVYSYPILAWTVRSTYSRTP